MRRTALMIVGLVVFAATAPTLVVVVRAAVPLVVGVGIAAVVLRIVWYFTNRY